MPIYAGLRTLPQKNVRTQVQSFTVISLQLAFVPEGAFIADS